MVDCVATSSYNLLFAVSVIVVITILLISYFSYDKVKKFEINELKEDAKTIKNAVVATISIAAVGIGAMLILFFGFRKQIGTSVAQTLGNVTNSFPLPSSLRTDM